MLDADCVVLDVSRSVDAVKDRPQQQPSDDYHEHFERHEEEGGKARIATITAVAPDAVLRTRRRAHSTVCNQQSAMLMSALESV
eukprot:3888766-Rhodomonas_salina.1